MPSTFFLILALSLIWTVPDLNLKLNITGAALHFSALILIVQIAGAVLFLPDPSLNRTVPDLKLNWTIPGSKFYFSDLILILNLNITGAALHFSVLILIVQIAGAVFFLPDPSLNQTVPDLKLNWTITSSKFYFSDLILILKGTGTALSNLNVNLNASGPVLSDITIAGTPYQPFLHILHHDYLQP